MQSLPWNKYVTTTLAKERLNDATLVCLTGTLNANLGEERSNDANLFFSRNGHVTCNPCRMKVQSCPMCREIDIDIRNLFAEKVRWRSLFAEKVRWRNLFAEK